MTFHKIFRMENNNIVSKTYSHIKAHHSTSDISPDFRIETVVYS